MLALAPLFLCCVGGSMLSQSLCWGELVFVRTFDFRYRKKLHKITRKALNFRVEEGAFFDMENKLLDLPEKL